MPIFTMVKYHKLDYPKSIACKAEEIAGHFDVTGIYPSMEYSLHTEYSYGKRKWTSKTLDGLDTLRKANKYGVPQLWMSDKWSQEFALYIERITRDTLFPNIIEIHPPFSDYSSSIAAFMKTYAVFENAILSKHPDTIILIENRAGSIYRGGLFTVSRLEELLELCNQIEAMNLQLRIALDIPQLYTSHHVDQSKAQLVTTLLENTIEIRQHIKGVHLWGKRMSEKGRWVAHCGDFDSYFNNDIELKTDFLSALCELFDDDICRKLVLEVNSGSSDLMSIINDLSIATFKYI